MNNKVSIAAFLTANVGGWAKGMQKANKSTQKFRKDSEKGMRGFSGSMKGIGMAINSALGVVAGVIAAGVAIKKAFDFGAELNGIRLKLIDIAGVTSETATKMTGSIKATSDTFGVETGNIIDSLNAIDKQMGGDSEGNLDYLNKGIALTQGKSEELLEQVKEYAPQFKAAGLGAEAMVSIMTQSIKGGIFNDKGADTIKEGMLRMREMTKSTKDALTGIGLSGDKIQEQISNGSISVFEAIQMVSAKIAELPEGSAAVGTAIADIFGGAGEDAGLGFITGIATMETSMDKLVENASDVVKSQIAVQESSAAAHEEFTKLFTSSGTLLNDLKVGFYDMLTGIGKWLNKIKELVIQAFGSKPVVAFMDYLKKLGSTIVDNTVRSFKIMLATMSAVANAFIGLYNESLIFRGALNLIIASFKSLWTIGTGVITALMDAMGNLGDAIYYTLTGQFSKAKESMIAIVTDTAKTFEDMGNDIADSFMDGVKNSLRGEKVSYIDLESSLFSTNKDAEKVAEEAVETFNDTVKSTSAKKPINMASSLVSSPLSGPDLPDVGLEEEDHGFLSSALSGGESLDELKAKLAEVKQLQSEAADPSMMIEYGNQIEEITSKIGSMGQTTMDSFTAASQAIAGLGSAVGGATGEWITMGASLTKLVPQMIGQIGSLFGAQTSLALASGAAQSQSVPFPFNLIALATTMASIYSAISSIPAFADGGIVSGPTIGLMGEYSGAKSNPEVIAPLSKLKNMISESNESSSGNGELRAVIKGRDIVLIQERQKKANRRY